MTPESPDDPPRRSPTDAARLNLGATLAKLRRQRGLTGNELGRLAGMSQAKVSKIENASVVPTPRDVIRLARALEAPEDVVLELAEQAERLHDRFTDWRLAARRLAANQARAARDEERARVVRSFQPAVVPGLLQTTEYARAILTDYASALTGESLVDEAAAGGPLAGEARAGVPSAVSARLSRQEVLADTSKQFLVVITEHVLENRVCSPACLLDQIQRLGEVARRANVTLRILRSDAPLTYPPLHGFHLFDDQAVLIDMMNTSVTSRGQADVHVYRTVFDHFYQRATPDIEPLLDQYARRYRGLAG
jgi:transcriptional regulator with XRE-family HTH domain